MITSTEDISANATQLDAGTNSGVKIATTAKGYLQPEFTLRYASADEALTRAASDWGTLFDRIQAEALKRGITLVTALN